MSISPVNGASAGHQRLLETPIIPDILDWVEKGLKNEYSSVLIFSPVSMLLGIIVWELGETSPECDTFPETGASDRTTRES